MQELIKAKLKEEGKIKQRKVYLVHGWEEGPWTTPWFLWLKDELTKKNFKVDSFEMPNTDEPKIDEWVNYLRNAVKDLDEETYFVGHSIGCQTILRFLEKLPESINIGGCVFVAGWFNLTDEAYEEEGDREIAKPWIETSKDISFELIKNHTRNFLGIFSDNDLFVSLSDAELFKERLGVEIIIKENEGHFNETQEIPEILDFLLRK